jgi:surface-anchored protein
MRYLYRVLLAVSALVAVILAGALPANAAVTLSKGHVDAVAPTWANNRLDLKVIDETGGSPVVRDPADVVFRALPGSRRTVPDDPRFAFLGDPGDPVWILPQTQDPDLLWPGVSTEQLPGGVFDNNRVRVRLASVTAPAGGQVSLYTTAAGGDPTVLFDSGNGLPDARNFAVGAHQHMNWAFEATGRYVLRFEVTASRNGTTVRSGVHAYTFRVG